MSRAAIVAAAQESIARGSRSFALASRLFAPDVRERAWLLYAWCRRCDDLADGQEAGYGQIRPLDPQARLATIRDLTEAALDGKETGDPAFDALGLVARECALPPALPRDLVHGFALDAAGFRPADEAALIGYCYHVAGVVGVMMALVMGVAREDEAVLDRACDLGIAFQLANIARDIGEDAAAGRCYLPADWLAAEGIAGSIHSARPELVEGLSFSGEGERGFDRLGPNGKSRDAHPYTDLMLHRPALARVARRLADGAVRYEASARAGAAALPFRSRWAVLAAADIYGGIAREVAARGERAWDERVATSATAKAACVARALRLALAPAPATVRAGLWTRPPGRLTSLA